MSTPGHGLTETEARIRLEAGQRNTVHLLPTRPRGLVRRESIFTIFHLNMLGLVFVQLLMGVWFGALITLLLGLATIGIRVVQDLAADRRLREVAHRMRSRSTVVREGRKRYIDSDEIVVGDLLVVGPGDQFQVDARMVGNAPIVVNSSLVTGSGGFQRLEAGDEVLAGAHCISGRGYCVAERVGRERLGHSRMQASTSAAAEPTPLERLVIRVLLGLLVVVLAFLVILLAKWFRLDVGDSGEILVEAAPVIFSLLPTGLYLMIIRTYASGTADLARMGALVHSARSVESLAESNVICFTDIELLSGTAVELTALPESPGNPDQPSLPQLRQLLGDFARSLPVPSPISDLLATTFEGEERPVDLATSHLATEGWLALQFDDPDDDRLLVLAEPRVVAARLAPSHGQAVDHLLGQDMEVDADGPTSNILVLAEHARVESLTDPDGMPLLPAGLVPLATLRYRRRIRSESVEVVRRFVASGVRIKVFSPWAPEEVVAGLRRGGFSSEDEREFIPGGGISGVELDAVHRSEWPRLVSEHRLFGALRPEQIADVVRVLRAGGKHVTVVGDGLTDLPALQAANLAVAQPGSAQAALGSADVVLLEQSAGLLLDVLHRGQSMVRGLLDLMKLNLSLVLCTALLIIGVRLTGGGFPYRSGHGSIISILAITVPSLLLPLWARHGAVDSSTHRRVLVRFVVPAGVSLGVVVFLVHRLFLLRSDSLPTAQLAAAWTLLLAGLTLSVLIQPPRAGDRGSWRTVVMAVVLSGCALLVPVVPTFRRWFRLELLPSVTDYLVVLAGTATWVLLLHGIWKLIPNVGPPAPGDDSDRGRG